MCMPGRAVGASMNPLAATIPEGRAGNDAVATQCPALWSPGMDLQRLFRLVMLFTQFSKAETAHDVPRPLDPAYGSPHSSSCCILIGHCGEERPSDVQLPGPHEVGTASAERVSAAFAAVARCAYVVPRRWILVHCRAAACADPIGANPRSSLWLVIVISRRAGVGVTWFLWRGYSDDHLRLGARTR